MRICLSLLVTAGLLASSSVQADPIPQPIGSIYFGYKIRPGQIAQAPGGTIYVPLQDNGQVATVDELGNIGPVAVAGLDQPTGVALDDSLNLYVCEQHAHQIRKYDRFMNLVTTWGGYGTAPGKLLLPTNLAFSSDHSKLYVTELWGGRVSVFDRNGAFLSSFGTQGSGVGQLDYPFGIVIDPATGEVLVANEMNNRIDRFSALGNYISSFGSLGTALGQFHFPVGLGRDPYSGDLYVTDQLNNRIEKFRANGTPVLEWGNAATFYNPWGVSVTQMGNIWVSDTYHYVIQIFSPSAPTPVANTTWGSLKARYR